MSSEAVTYAVDRTRVLARVADYVQLTKPRIAVLELLTVAAGFYLAAEGRITPALFHVLLGTGLVAAGASAMNMVLERRIDLGMARTAGRPIPAGRIGAAEATVFAAVLLIGGLLELICCVNWLTALLGLLSWQLYVWVYTPLKRISGWNTLVGAVPGALPIVMGWTGAVGTLTWQAWALFAVMFCWQFPHFMAICWLCRDEYRRVGIRMISVGDATGSKTGWTAVLTSLLLIVAGWLPWVAGMAGMRYMILATLLGIGMTHASWTFLRAPSTAAARSLLRVSLLYVPLVFAALLCDAIFPG